MNINTIKEWFDFICNSYQKGNVNGDEFNLLFNQNQLNYYDFLIGHVEQFQPGRPVTRVGLGVENIMTKLSPFIKSATVAVTAQQAPKPSTGNKFARLIAMYDGSGNKIDRVEHDRKAGRVGSTVLPPVSNPFYVEYGSYWEIYPSALTSIKIDYLPQKPDDAEWGFDDSSGREVYDADASTDPLWYDTEIAAILGRMFKSMGVVLDDGQILGYGQSIINAGE